MNDNDGAGQDASVLAVHLTALRKLRIHKQSQFVSESKCKDSLLKLLLIRELQSQSSTRKSLETCAAGMKNSFSLSCSQHQENE